MKIIYGVSGEGFGHSSRAKEILWHLRKQGHKILVLTYGQAISVLKEFPMIKIEGVKFVVENNKIHTGKTIIESIRSFSKNIKNWPKIQNRIDKFKPDICITDFEPLTAIIRFWRNIPLISIDNQHRLTHIPLKVPKRYRKDFLIAKNIVNICVSRADYFIILSFTKVRPKTKNTFIVSPILRKEILSLKPKRGDKILVYLNKPNSSFIKILKNINQNFIVYGFNKSKKEKNIQFKQIGLEFLSDLANCKAVIGTSGFTLISESLYLKKPYFALPMQSQFEQTLNALFLKNSKLGDFSDNPNKKQIQRFISSLSKYRKNLKNYNCKPNEAMSVLDSILKKF